VILIRKSLTLTVIINIKIPNKILFRSWDARACCCDWVKTQFCSTIAKCSCAKLTILA
jgi:hypothetical protein